MDVYREEAQVALWEAGAIAFFRRRLGLTQRQAELFMALDSSYTTCTDLAQVLFTTPAAISRISSALISKGLAERDDFDPCAKISFYLTPKGKMELDVLIHPGERVCRSVCRVDIAMLPVMTKADFLFHNPELRHD